MSSTGLEDQDDLYEEFAMNELFTTSKARPPKLPVKLSTLAMFSAPLTKQHEPSAPLLKLMPKVPAMPPPAPLPIPKAMANMPKSARTLTSVDEVDEVADAEIAEDAECAKLEPER